MASPPRELPRNALFDAAATGNIPTIAAYFGQRYVQAEVSETNAFLLTHAPSALLPRDPRRLPWFQQPAIDHMKHGFFFDIAIENQQLEVLKWFFTSPERVETMGATLALLLPGIGHRAMFAGKFAIDVIEMLLTSLVYRDCLDAAEKMHLLNQFVNSTTRGPVMLQLLIAHGASVNYTEDGHFAEPLVNLTAQKTDNSNEIARFTRDPDHVDVLVDHGAFVVGLNSVGRGSFNVDHHAAIRLLKLGADWRGNDAREVLLDREMARRVFSVTIPVVYGFADVDMQDEDGSTLLMLVLQRRDTTWRNTDAASIVELLLDTGADIHLRDINGRTALHFAVASARVREARMLLENGADPNASTNNGTRPMDDCTQLLPTEQGWEMLEALLQHGADPFATRKGELSVYEILRSCERGVVFVEKYPQYF